MTDYVREQWAPRQPPTLGLNVEISYNGLWWGLNDHYNYKYGVDGFGTHDITWRRKTVTSDFFDGEYLVRKAQEAVKRQHQVYVYGQDQLELEQNLKNLIGWFSQDAYNVRVTRNGYIETWLCDPADINVDGSHVYLHNRMYVVKLGFSSDPQVSVEVLL